MLYPHSKNPTELKIIHLNDARHECREQLLKGMNDKQGIKKLNKQLAKKAKALLKHNKINNKKTKHKHSDERKGDQSDKKVFVLDFDGDVKASAVQKFREEISAVISVAHTGDEVVVRLESSGGMVHSYGLAAAQLIRLKDAKLSVTVCVDKVAASGGYMMACVADKILAAPFAVIGSIGVVAQLPNFHRFLKNHDIDYEMFTAGEYKRTVTIFGENSDKDRDKFTQELEQTHQLFKHFVTKYRPSLALDKVATGEHWYGEDAIALGLIDKISTSDSYLLELMDEYQLYALHTCKKPTMAEKLGLIEASETLLTKVIDRVVDTAVDSLPVVLAKAEQAAKVTKF